jgi:hypothetical protein
MSPKKNKAPESAPANDKKKGKKGEEVLASETENIPWWNEAMAVLDTALATSGGVSEFLDSEYKSSEEKLAFAQWLDRSFPAETGIAYAKDFSANGALNIRLYNLCWHKDSGNKGLVVEEKMRNLVMLILARGFRTDADLYTCEKLNIICADPLLFPLGLPCMPVVHAGEMPAFSVNYVKGWTRAVAALMACHIFKTLDIVEKIKLDAPMFETFVTVYCLKRPWMDTASSVDANLGLALCLVQASERAMFLNSDVSLPCR